MKGIVILQFCGLRCKCYSLVTPYDQKMAVAGVKKYKHKCLKHHLFVEAIASSSVTTVEQNSIISKNHSLYVQKMKRTALSILDIKRVILSDDITTVPHGYFN